MINYMRSAVEQFVKYKSEHYVIRSEGHEIVEQAFLIACCNASQYGNNTFIAPRASITDGLMDVTVVHAGTRLGSFLTGIEIMAGTLGDSARVHTFRTSHLTIERTSPGSAHIDGEPVTLDRILEIRCHPATLKVFSPRRNARPPHHHPGRRRRQRHSTHHRRHDPPLTAMIHCCILIVSNFRLL